MSLQLSTEQKVGLFFLVALVALAVMIELVEDWRPFETQNDYRTFFQSAVGIKAGDPVRLAGVEVGKIRRITLEDGRVRVDFYVVGGTDLRRDTEASIRQMNLLGGQFLGLRFGTPGSPPLPPSSEVPSVEGTNIDQLISNLDRNQEKAFGTLGKLLEESRTGFVDAVSRLDSIARKIDQGQGTLARLVNDPQLYDEVTAAVRDLKTVVGRLEGGEGSLGKLLADDSLYREASATLANLKVISGKARRGEGTLGRLVNDPELYDQTRNVMSRLASIAEKIDEGQGTLGQLVNDDSLYRDAKTTLHKVEKAADGIGDSGTVSALGTVVGTLF